MKTVDIEQLRKRYIFHAEMKAAKEIDQIIRELKKYDLKEPLYSKDDVLSILTSLRSEIVEFRDKIRFEKDTLARYENINTILENILDKKISEVENG